MTILTTGVTGPLVARQEIRTMLLDKELFTLYILALARFQKTDQADLLSYFQIAGIHGRPYVAYDGATGVGNFGGYCTHSSILFPPWHRPYLALFEQALNKHVNDIANDYPAANKSTYTAAAKRFRIPYWDWALTADLPDVIARQHQLTIDTPQGVQTIPNPLYTYTFHPLYQDFGDGLSNEQVWESWRSTVRYPTSQTGTAQSDDQAMERTLDNNRLTIRDRTYNLLTNATDYAAFSNDGFLNGMGPTGYESLESIHNSIHGLTGRDGHMGVVDFSSFDPVFWLHHTAVDRVFAMWQALNPQSYVIPRENQGGTFATRAGTIEDANTPLAPFWKSQGVFWTAAGVRDTRTFNYTYPELVNWANLNPSTKNTRIRSDINAMYGRTAAWGTLNPGIFNVQPSVPITAPPVSSFGTPALPGKPAAHAVPAVSSKAAVVADKAPEANVASSARGSAQAVIKAPLDADSIRKTVEEDMKAVHDKVAAAVHEVVEKVEGAVHHVEDEYHNKTPVDYKPPSEYHQAPPPTTYKPTPPTGYSEPPTGYKSTPPVEPPTSYTSTPPSVYKPSPPVETPYKPTPPTGYSEPPTGYHSTPPVEPPTGYNKPTPPTGYSEPPSGYKSTPPVVPPASYTPPSVYKPSPPVEPPYKPTPPTGYSEPPTGYHSTPPVEPPTGYNKPTPPTGYSEPPSGYKSTPPVEPPTSYTPPSVYKPSPPVEPPYKPTEPPVKPPPATTYHEPPTTYNPAPPNTYKPAPPADYKPPSEYHEPPKGYQPPPATTYHEPPTAYNPAPPSTYKPTPPADYKPPSEYHEPPKGYQPPPATTYHEPPTAYNPAAPSTYKSTPHDYKPPSEYHESPTGYQPPPATTYHEPPTTYNPAPPNTYKPTPPADYKPPSEYHEPPKGYQPPPVTTYHEHPTTYNPAPPGTYKPTPPTEYPHTPVGYQPPPTTAYNPAPPGTYKPTPPTEYPHTPVGYQPPPTTTYNPAPPGTYKPTPPTEYPHTPVGYQPPPTQYKPPTDYGKGPVDTGVVYAGKKDYIEWIANINVEKYAAKRTFFVYIFLGEFNPDSTKWAQDPNLVGIHVVFANNMTYTGCERCRDQAEERKLVTGTIPLTGALGDKLGKSKVGSLQPAEVIPYLKKELHWRIQTHDQKVIERDDMPSLKVSVASIPVKLPENINEFPVWGEGSRHTDVTAGRPAGANHDDQE